ncbi:MAG: hypothetical protein EZS28_055363, partial [Streblomastix strix]
FQILSRAIHIDGRSIMAATTDSQQDSHLVGATADNHFATFVEMGQDQDINLNNLIGICVDGASNMIECRHSKTSKVVEKFKSVIVVHCCSH